MIIHHSSPRREFTRIPNDTLRDERLSFAARGMLAYLLSLPDGWNTTADAESKRARSLRGKRGEGREATRRVYAELKAAGYTRYIKVPDNGVWRTVIHVADRPGGCECPGGTDARLTDVPETRTSVRPAETEFAQVAPMYGSPGVGTPGVGEPVRRQAVRSYEDGTKEDGEGQIVRVGDGVDDKGPPPDLPQGQGQEPSAANSQNRRVPDGSETVADEAQEISSNDSESVTAGSCAREPARLAGHWRSPQQIAADQAAESRALRQAAERQAQEAAV